MEQGERDKTRVLHVVRRLDVPRGAERLVAELVRTQPTHDVLVFDGAGSFYDLGTGKIVSKKGFFAALRYCRAQRGSYDVFHLHMAPAIYLALVLGRGAVIHMHSSYYARWSKLHLRLLGWMTYRRPRATIAVSDAARQGLCKHFGAVPRLHALPNFAADLRGRAQATPHKVPEGTTLLMVASLARPKRQDIALRALAELPQTYRLVLAGTGAEQVALEALAAELHVQDRVTFAGAVRDMASLYQTADLCLLLSDWEGFGLVVVEAAQFGVPTVVNDVEGLRQSCPDPRLLVSDLNPDAVARKIMEIAALQDKAAFEGTLAAHVARHGVAAYAAQLEKIYHPCA